APDRVRSPEDVIRPGNLDHLTKHVQAPHRIAHGELLERAAQLEVDVADLRIAAKDAEDIADPRDFLGIVALGIFYPFAGATGEEAGPAIAGVVDDEIEVGEIAGGTLQVQRRAGPFIEGAQRQSLVHAQIADAELLRPLPEGIRDLLIIHEPGLL